MHQLVLVVVYSLGMGEPMRRRESGYILPLVLLIAAVIAAILAVSVVLTANVSRTAQNNYASQVLKQRNGGYRLIFNQALMGYIAQTVKAAAAATAQPSATWYYGTGNGSSPSGVVQAMAQFAQEAQSGVSTAFCGHPYQAATTETDITIYFTPTACGNPLPAGVSLPPPHYLRGAPSEQTSRSQEYSLPFVALVTTKSTNSGTATPYAYTDTINGAFNILFIAGAVSHFGLAVNSFFGPTGTPYTLTSSYTIFGPLFTNGIPSFAGAPWIGGELVSASCPQVSATGCAGAPTPGLNLNTAGFIPLNKLSSSPSQPCIDNAACPLLGSGYSVNGSYMPISGNRLVNGFPAATDQGISVPSNAAIVLYPSSVGTLHYQEIAITTQGQATEIYRFDRVGELDEYGGNAWRTIYTAQDPFNGLVYVHGSITSLASNGPTAISSFAHLSLVATGNIYITGNLRYESPPCSTQAVRTTTYVQPPICNNLGAPNVLGIASTQGDILIAHDSSRNAPTTLTIEATLLAPNGYVGTENLGTLSGSIGTLTILGSITEDYFGQFGVYNSTTGVPTNGYALNINYDPRYWGGAFAPPLWPYMIRPEPTIPLAVIPTISTGSNAQ